MVNILVDIINVSAKQIAEENSNKTIEDDGDEIADESATTV